MAGGEVQNATPLRCDHQRYGGQGGHQRTRENQNTHHDHHDASLLPFVTIRHINPTVTIDFSVQFRRQDDDIRSIRAKFTTLRIGYAAINPYSLL